MRRQLPLSLLVALAALTSISPGRAALAPLHIDLVADEDDDDVDGTPDGKQAFLPPPGRVDLVPLPPTLVGAIVHPISGGEHARVVVAGRPLPWGAPLPAGASLQGLSAGRMSGVLTRGADQAAIEVAVTGVQVRDGSGERVDTTTGHASIERAPPARAEGGWDAHYDDADALRFVLAEPEGRPGGRAIEVLSLNERGAVLDSLPRPALGPAACDPGAAGLRCQTTLPLRFVIDDVDRGHALVKDRSLRVELGGAVVVVSGGRKLQAIRVLGPRGSSIGPIGRLRATLRPVVVRVSPGGAPAIGGTEAGAVTSLRAELALASAVWGQCGLSLGAPDALEVRIVDPPPPHMIAIGDDVGLPAGGGEIHLKIDARKSVAVPVARGQSPLSVALALARAVSAAGYVAVVSENARIGPAAAGSVDVSVRRRDGSLVALEPATPAGPLTTDPKLSVRIGAVDLSDGLQHFGDMDSAAGTLEERTLLKALDDGDPGTIEIVIVPFFAGGGRIGESFIGGDVSSVRNVVLLDRAGIRARRSSLTLAHELGHVLLDQPGHPDDYGFDTPTSLMDSDASDASPFGPRRIAVEECARVVRQSGPASRSPLLVDWPIAPIPYTLRHE